MEKFRYLSSADHASWYVANLEDGIEVSSNMIGDRPSNRVEIREWIEQKCQGTVYAWNKVSTPAKGEVNWGKMIAPQGDMAMFFENVEDRVLFQLTWC